MKSNLKERAMGRIARLMGLMDETIGAANMYRCHDHRYRNGIRRNAYVVYEVCCTFSFFTSISVTFFSSKFKVLDKLVHKGMGTD